MNDRVNPFAVFSEAPSFTTKPKKVKPVDEEAIASIAKENSFPSRQVTKTPKAERRKPRLHRTGRNMQFNAKATPETIAKIYKIADERKLMISELLELAVAALEKDTERKQVDLQLCA